LLSGSRKYAKDPQGCTSISLISMPRSLFPLSLYLLTFPSIHWNEARIGPRSSVFLLAEKDPSRYSLRSAYIEFRISRNVSQPLRSLWAWQSRNHIRPLWLPCVQKLREKLFEEHLSLVFLPLTRIIPVFSWQ
jgi:hypothetical protein